MKDIQTLEDIQLLVDEFYGSVRSDITLAHIFNTVIGDRWDEHLERMYSFWQTVLLSEHTYSRSPFPPHAQLPVSKTHFDTWLRLWYQAINNHFDGPKADEAKWRADKMASMFLSKIQYYQSRSRTPLL